MPTTIAKITKTHARKFLSVIKHGLSHGLGQPEPGRMCIEAAWCYALGLPHSDTPPCVGSAVRSFKIALNDSSWSSNEARAKGMAKLGVAQAGSDQIDQTVFVKELTRLTVKKLLPATLRIAADIHQEQKHKVALEKAAKDCEAIESFDAASDVARAARDAALAARAASAAALAASAASYAASYAASDAASYAASAAARAASAAASAASAAASDKMFCLMADIGVEALQICGSPGCQWLDLVES